MIDIRKLTGATGSINFLSDNSELELKMAFIKCIDWFHYNMYNQCGVARVRGTNGQGYMMMSLYSLWF